MEKGERSVYRIAKLQNVTPRWVREIYRRYKETGEYPYPDKPGRKPSLISDVERRIVLEIRKQHPVCAVTLEKILDREGIHIPHNRIHRILKEEREYQGINQRNRSAGNGYAGRGNTVTACGIAIGLSTMVNILLLLRMMLQG